MHGLQTIRRLNEKAVQEARAKALANSAAYEAKQDEDIRLALAARKAAQ